MSHVSTLILVVSSLALGTARAEDAPQQLTASHALQPEPALAVGLGAGTTASGVTGKYTLGEGLALQGFLGVGVNGRDEQLTGATATVGLDVVKEFTVHDFSSGRLFWGLGVGAGVLKYWDEERRGPEWVTSRAGVGSIVEVGWRFSRAPVELVADLRPTLETVNGGVFTQFDATRGGGALRWYFR